MWQPRARSDPDKPNCPYLPGFEADISTHTAPPPFGRSGFYPPSPPGAYTWLTREWEYSVTQTQNVLAHPPLETPAPAHQNTARLVVKESLAIGNARGAQILLCSITPYEQGAKAFEAVAKIYDPLYYAPFTHIGNYPADTVSKADEDYSIEATAYEYLKVTGQTGSFAPAFFGSWTFSLPTTYKQETRRRNVRLILIEYLPGICMKDLFAQNGFNQIDATHLNEGYRLQVLAILLDGVAKQHHAGVDQCDLAPRNVIIIPPPDSTAKIPQRVALIDYNIAKVWELSEYGKLPAQLARLPQNPMERFWTSYLMDLSGWAPPEWWDNRRLSQEWLRREFGGEKEKLYEPVVEELELDESTQEDLEAVGQTESKLPDTSVGHSSSKSHPNGTDKFEVVPEPRVLDGDRRPPSSGFFFMDMKAALKAYEDGQLQD